MRTAIKTVLLMGSKLKYLLRGLFEADEDPLTSPHSLVPGPGTLTRSHTGGSAKLSGGELQLTVASAAWEAWYADAQSDYQGVAVYGRATTPGLQIGWSSGSASPNDRGLLDMESLSATKYDDGTNVVSIGDLSGAGVGAVIPISPYRNFVLVDGKIQYISDVSGYSADASRVPRVARYTVGTGAMDEFGVLNLPANGYDVWERDFSEVTDSLSAPASGTTFNLPIGGKCKFSFTYEDGVSVYLNGRYTDVANRWNILAYLTGGALYIHRRTTASGTEVLYASSGFFTDGRSYEIHTVDDGQNLTVWIDGVKLGTWDISAVPAVETGQVTHSLTTNDIELTSHPYPALGTATSRVVCPQSGDTQDCPADCQVILRGVTLPTSGSITHAVRYVDDNNQVYIEADSAGNLYLKQVVSGTTTTLITGTMTDGEDIQVHVDGSLGRLWHGTTKLTDTTAITHTSGSTAKRTDSSDGWMEWAACWPIDPGNNLPKALK